MLCASFVILQLSLICEVGNKAAYLASFRIKSERSGLKGFFFFCFEYSLQIFRIVYLILI